MYKSYYGLRKKPFPTTPDPDHVYMSRGYAYTYAHLEYALREDRGFLIITGEPGSGKTSLINLLVKEFETVFRIEIMRPDVGKPGSFLETFCLQLGVDLTGIGTTEILGTIKKFLIRQRGAGNRVIFIVDDAQNLPDTALEEIRILANLEINKRYLVQIILVGQKGLGEKLLKNKLRQFIRRVTVCCRLQGLEHDEIKQYISYRLKTVGESAYPEIFDKGAIEAIYYNSKGIPKIVNIISEAALLYGYADELKIINEEVIGRVLKESHTNNLPAYKEEKPKQNEGVDNFL